MLPPPFNFSHNVSLYKGLAVNPSKMRCPLYFEKWSPEEQSQPGRGRRTGHGRPEKSAAGACLPPASAAQAGVPHGDEARRPRWGRGHRPTWAWLPVASAVGDSALRTQGVGPGAGVDSVGRPRGMAARMSTLGGAGDRAGGNVSRVGCSVKACFH